MNAENNEKKETKEELVFLLKKLAVIIVAVLIIFNFIYGIKCIEGQDMFPTIRDGDVLLYFRLTKAYNISDVVVYEANGEKYVSRIVAKSGDVINMTESGGLIVNGNEQQEDIYFSTYPSKDGVDFPYKVEEGCVFVLGDYRSGAKDSRIFGSVSLDNIKGKVFTVVRRRGI